MNCVLQAGGRGEELCLRDSQRFEPTPLATERVDNPALDCLELRPLRMPPVPLRQVLIQRLSTCLVSFSGVLFSSTCLVSFPGVLFSLGPALASHIPAQLRLQLAHESVSSLC